MTIQAAETIAQGLHDIADAIRTRNSPPTGSAQEQWFGLQVAIAFEASTLGMMEQWKQIRAAFEQAHPEYKQT